MARAFIRSKNELAQQHARAIQFLLGAAAVTVSITWADEGDTKIEAATHTATVWGVTSKDRPVGSLPEKSPALLAMGHLNETTKHTIGLAENVAKQTQAPETDHESPPQEDDPHEIVADVAAPEVESQDELHE